MHDVRGAHKNANWIAELFMEIQSSSRQRKITVS
jgi:hypothetical protein